MRRRVAIALVCIGLAACGGGDGGGKPLPIPDPPAAGTIGDGTLGELVEWARASQELPAMGVVVVQSGQIAEQAAVGRRSVSLDVPVTTGDRWHLGSLTKAMTATLAAVLVEQSLIDWDTTALEVWPEFDANIHPDFRDVTLRQLLSHTSGMVRDADSGGFGDGASGTTKEKRRNWAAQLLSRSAIGPAGEHSYSNVGYVVAAAMLEERSGTPWETLMTEQVFAPLGMTGTAFGAPGTAGETDEPLGHRDNGARFEAVEPAEPGADIPRSLGPAGNVHTTFADYARYMSAHIAGARGVPGLVTVQSFEELHTPVDANYALGWGVGDDFPIVGGAVLAHDGSNLRWYARVWLSTSHDGGVLIVTNAGSRQAVAAVDALDNVLRQRFAASQ